MPVEKSHPPRHCPRQNASAADTVPAASAAGLAGVNAVAPSAADSATPRRASRACNRRRASANRPDRVPSFQPSSWARLRPALAFQAAQHERRAQLVRQPLHFLV